MDLCQALREHAARNPSKTALFCVDRTINYRDFDLSSTRLAKWFLDEGLQPCDRIALHWQNSFESALLFFAIFKAGLVAVPVNVRLKPAEIRYVVDHSHARICFSEPSLASLAKQAGSGCSVLSEVPMIASTEAMLPDLPAVRPEQPAAILYTSGTTAHPKGVTHTHSSLFETAAMMAREVLAPDEVALAITQLMHASGLNGVFLPTLYMGASVVLIPNFEPSAVLNAIERFRCTYTLSLPALLQFITEEQARAPRDVSSLRTVLAGGDTVSVALQNRFESLFKLSVREVYGMTETLPLTLNPQGRIRAGSVGLAVDGVRIRLVDLDGHEVKLGETGEITVQSATNCVGYWNNVPSTKSTIRDGWLHTGDLAYCDVDGYYWFKGRTKQIIIRGGSNISPQEVEEALYRHRDVLEAGVVGAPDPVYGEIVVAFVVLRENSRVESEELRRFARETLADYKVPERIFFLSEIPKGPTGKVHRRVLKEMLVSGAATVAAN
jgi:long-chain acyl-CoA synthetase